MKGFIEVTISNEKVLLNITTIDMIAPRPASAGSQITVFFGGPNEDDTVLYVSETYDELKQKIVTATQ